jgi:hypothetical protein
MNCKSITVRQKCLVRFALVTTVSIVVTVSPAFAKLAANTVNPLSALSGNGKELRVTGPISCTMTQPVLLRVTVTQRATGAAAEGYARLVCTTTTQQWQVIAHASGNTPFEPGSATVVVVARSAVAHGQFDDAHQWLVNVTLVPEP